MGKIKPVEKLGLMVLTIFYGLAYPFILLYEKYIKKS